MVRNKQSFSTFPASPSSSFSSSAASSMVPPATPPSRSGILTADQLPSPSSITFKSIFGVPPASHHLSPCSSTPSMGQVVSRPQVTTASSPSSLPSSLGVSASNAGSRFKRAFVGRRKKSDVATPPSPTLDKGKEPQIDDPLLGIAPRQLGAKQRTLQFAQHVLQKKSAPASPAMSGLSLPPPPPPKSASPSSHLTPISTNMDQRTSIMTTSSPIVPALDYMRKSDEHTEQVVSKENARRDLEGSESKDVRRKSDSTLSLQTIRPTLGNKTPRPVSLAESLHSTHTIVPVNKRLSALITDAEYVMAEEEDGAKSEEKGRLVSRPSPASSLRIRERRSQSLNLAPPLSLMVSGPAISNATMSLEAIAVTLPRSASEGCERECLVTGELATTFSSLSSDTSMDAVVRHVNAISSLNRVSDPTSRIERSLPDLPNSPQRTTSPLQAHSHPSLRQTAISMTSGFAPAAGLARRAVERMGRVWGSKGSFSSPLASPLGESSNGRTGPPTRTSSNYSESTHHGWKVRHTPQTPSVSSTASSLSDYEGPQLGQRLRDPIRIPPSGSSVGGLVFGRELKICVDQTAVDNLRALRKQNVAHGVREETDITEHVQWSQPSAPLEKRHVPALVVRCTQHILTWGVQEQGLFRVSGRSSHVAKLRAEFDTGADFDIVQSNPGDLDPHAVASVFKAYLRELPEPILTSELTPYFEAAMASERLTNNIQDPPALNKFNHFHELRKPPSLSTLGMPSFGGTQPPSDSLRKVLSSLISRLPQENRDLLLTVTEVINHTAKRSSETKMPLSNLLLVLCPSLSMNPSLLQALCESQGIWNDIHQSRDALELDAIMGGTSQPSVVPSEVAAGTNDSVGTSQSTPLSRPSSANRCFTRPLPSLPNADESHASFDTEETSSPSLSTMDDSSSGSHLSQSGRPVTPTSLNFKLTNPYSPPSLSCSTDSLSVPSMSSGSPMQLVKPLTLVDEYSEQQQPRPPHSPDIVKPIPLPTPTLEPTQPPSQAQLQFPGPHDAVTRNPLMHYKSTPSISISSSISAEARSASMANRARRLKKPSLHLLFKHNLPSSSLPTTQSTVVSVLQDGDIRTSYTSDSSPDSMVTAQSTRFSYPPVLNTAIDESSISLALGIEDDTEERATSVGYITRDDMTNPQGSGGSNLRNLPGECGEDSRTQSRHLDVTFPEEEQSSWTKSVLMAAGESGW